MKPLLSRTARLLMISMLASLSLTACGGSTASTDTTAPTAETTTQPVETGETLDLPATDWEGRQFRVLGYQHTREQFCNFEIDSDGENGDVVNDAIYRRNTKIEDTYNVEIVQTLDGSDTSPQNSTMKHIRETTLAGEDLYDLVFVTIQSIGTVAREGLLYDLNTIDHIDFTKSWWNPEVNEALEVSDRLFFTNSDFSLRDKSRAYIMLFNKALVEKFALGDPFQMVRDGKWTLDIMTEWAKAVAGDLNGNGQVDFEDNFGLVTDSYNGIRTLAFGAGMRILDNNDGELELVMNSERNVDVIEKAITLNFTDYLGSTCEKWSGKVDFDYWSFSGKAFQQGRALFCMSFPHGLKSYSANSVDDYGIIPFGKYDEDQDKYYTYADTQGMLFGIPSTTPDPDFSGFMLEALSCEAQSTSLPAYYEVSCKTKYTYDEQSAEMLDLIFDGIVFDTSAIYGISGVGGLLYDLAKSETNDFASRYASAESSAKADLEKLVKELKTID